MNLKQYFLQMTSINITNPNPTDFIRDINPLAPELFFLVFLSPSSFIPPQNVVYSDTSANE